MRLARRVAFLLNGKKTLQGRWNAHKCFNRYPTYIFYLDSLSFSFDLTSGEVACLDKKYASQPGVLWFLGVSFFSTYIYLHSIKQHWKVVKMRVEEARTVGRLDQHYIKAWFGVSILIWCSPRTREYTCRAVQNSVSIAEPTPFHQPLERATCA